MDWQQKLMALKALCETHLCMREPGNWYVQSIGRSVIEREGRIEVGSCGNGATPEAAVNNDWDKVAKPGYALRITGKGYMRWNGFMWESFPDFESVKPYIKKLQGSA